MRCATRLGPRHPGPRRARWPGACGRRRRAARRGPRRGQDHLGPGDRRGTRGRRPRDEPDLHPGALVSCVPPTAMRPGEHGRTVHRGRTFLHADLYRLEHLGEVVDLAIGRVGGGRRRGRGGVGRRGRAGARRETRIGPPGRGRDDGRAVRDDRVPRQRRVRRRGAASSSATSWTAVAVGRRRDGPRRSRRRPSWRGGAGRRGRCARHGDGVARAPARRVDRARHRVRVPPRRGCAVDARRGRRGRGPRAVHRAPRGGGHGQGAGVRARSGPSSA